MRNGLYCHNQLSDHFPALSYGIKTSHGATAPRRKKNGAWGSNPSIATLCQYIAYSQAQYSENTSCTKLSLQSVQLFQSFSRAIICSKNIIWYNMTEKKHIMVQYAQWPKTTRRGVEPILQAIKPPKHEMQNNVIVVCGIILVNLWDPSMVIKHHMVQLCCVEKKCTGC